jgi:hypothetical protein
MTRTGVNDMSEDRTAGLNELMTTAARLLGMLKNHLTASMGASSLEKERPSIWFARKYVRGCLLRVLSLGTSTMAELERSNLASAALLSRSVIETSAMLELFDNNLSKVATGNDPQRLRTVVSSHYLGTKAFELAGSAKAPHVMDAVRAAKKKEDWIQSVYDMLSDVAHPNWAGTTQLFLDDVGRWSTECRINREFAIDLSTNILLGLYSVRLALDASNHIEGVLNELVVSATTRGI